jgi:hypothetical protein
MYNKIYMEKHFSYLRMKKITEVYPSHVHLSDFSTQGGSYPPGLLDLHDIIRLIIFLIAVLNLYFENACNAYSEHVGV